MDGEGHTVAHVATNHCHQAWECVRCGCVSEWDNYGERTCWCDSCSSCVGGRACKYPPHRHAMEHEMKQIFAVLAAQLRPGMCSVPAKERGSPANLRRLGRYHWYPLLWVFPAEINYSDPGYQAIATMAHCRPWLPGKTMIPGKTMAHCAALHSAEALTTLAGLLPPAQWRKLAVAEDHNGYTVAHHAAMTSAAALTTLAGLLPPAQWHELAAVMDNKGRTVAHFAALGDCGGGEYYSMEHAVCRHGGYSSAVDGSATRLRTLAEMLPPAQWQSLVTAADERGYTVAHCAALHSATVLKTLAGLLPATLWQELAAAQPASCAYAEGMNLAHYAAMNTADPAAALGTLVELLPPARWLELAAARDEPRAEPREGRTPEDLANDFVHWNGGSNEEALSALRLLRRLLQPAAGMACCSAATAAALLVADGPGLRAALAAEEREAHQAGGRRPRDKLARLAAAVAAGDAPLGSLPCVTAVAEECALVAAQQRLALAVALFASGSRLKRRGFVRESPFVSGALLPGLAAVLSKDDKAARLYDVLAGTRDRCRRRARPSA